MLRNDTPKWSEPRHSGGSSLARAGAEERTSEAPRESEQPFRKVFEEGPLGMALVDSSFRLARVNRRLCEMLGYSEEELTSFTFPEITHPADIATDVSLAHRVFEGRVPYYQIDKRYLRKDGSTIWVSLTASVVRDENGRALYGLAMFEDIHDRIRAEDESRRHRDELARVSRVATLGEFAASLAHELNQPLCSIVSNAQAAVRLIDSDSADPAVVADALREIVTEGQRAGEVMRRLHGLLKNGDGKRQSVDLNSAIDEVVSLTRKGLADDRLSVTLDLAEDLPHVTGDRVQLQQVVLNLIVNAKEAMNELGGGPHDLLIRTSRSGPDHVEVAVRDSGVGLDPATKDRMFDAFFSTKPEGMGIGLSIDRTIVEAHGGRIRATQNSDRGATFHVTLPVERPGGP